ncbi:23S rRNA (pseudouridine(1915)-N(3))-methyltransferase RlmH [Methyloceanibacter sp.]|uniref:23S rRNA (pseudouridine(1915)-N(3))-methyltransferase RlmH n=1 Tax=Methyloceanibacter sp. TaxID=1965321 RepID=UPI002D53CDC5|nr:23S rRNA (pseudouridine(1915)-N(3))-methyltransferase RlmH [Methyloceanibacter sp.]HZP08261.1 23S rRNA (pseudouridine(1915)-N(3))-methyltransferase RlmH [Methyloceanibacter sp.]
MRLLIAAVGRLKQGPERDLFAHYVGRALAAGRKVALSPLEVVEIAEAKGASPQARMEAEAEMLLAKRPSSYKLICLDRGGTEMGSEAFARDLAKLRDSGAPGLAFFVGGADGLGLRALDEADLVISFGKLTLPHGLARIVLAEQIYRAITILSGHPYHRA